MPGTLQPLDQKFAIVDAQGCPTRYFVEWAQQKQIDITDSITLADLQTYLTEHMLREGSGIQFSPDGDLNNSPIIAADVQEILDQITMTRGAVLYRGLLGWASLPPGTSGQFLKTQGAGADPVWAAAGGGGRIIPNIGDLLSLASFTQDNTNANRTIVENAGKAISMIAANSVAAVQVHGLRRAVPAATPYRVAMLVQSNGAGWRYYGPAFGWSNGTAHHLCYDQSQNFEYAPWTNSSSRGAVTSLGQVKPLPLSGGGTWLGLQDDGTNWIWELSSDGANFHPIRTMAKVAGYTQIYMGLFSFNQDVAFGSTTLLYYDEKGLTRVAG